MFKFFTNNSKKTNNTEHNAKFIDYDFNPERYIEECYSKLEKFGLNKEKEAIKLKSLHYSIFHLDEKPLLNFITVSLLPEKLRERFLSEFIESCIKGENTIDDLNEVCKRLHSSKLLYQKYLTHYFNSSIQLLFRNKDIEACDNSSNFLLQKNEFVVIEFDCRSLTKKTRTEYHSGRAGASVRVAKGLWVNVGGTKGQSEKTEYLAHKSTGVLSFTNKRIVFSGEDEAFTIKPKDIINVEVKDGITYFYTNRKNPYIVSPDIELTAETFRVIINWILEHN